MFTVYGGKQHVSISRLYCPSCLNKIHSQRSSGFFRHLNQIKSRNGQHNVIEYKNRRLVSSKTHTSETTREHEGDCGVYGVSGLGSGLH